MDNEAPELAEKQKSTSTAANAPIPAGGAPGLAARREAPTSLPPMSRRRSAAFDEVGGADYLKNVAQTDPRTFCTLLGKILPTQVAGDTEAGPVRIEFAWLPQSSES
jgi:hypothetical protein